jgi:RNA polymerase sigma-70 factor (ECF subfamily)
VNASIDFLRKEYKNNRNIKHLDMNDVNIADKSKNLEESLVISEKTQLMYKCIGRLTFIDKTIISLYLEDLSYQEIAEVVGITEKNVSVKIYRIKKNLNECLRDK